MMRKFMLLSTKRGQKNDYADAVKKMRDSGAFVYEIKHIHNKTIVVGNNFIVEGSFNWLSALRDENSSYSSYESSWAIEGNKAKESIVRALNDFEGLGVNGLQKSDEQKRVDARNS